LGNASGKAEENACHQTANRLASSLLEPDSMFRRLQIYKLKPGKLFVGLLWVGNSTYTFSMKSCESGKSEMPIICHLKLVELWC